MHKPDWVPWEETAGPDWDAFVEAHPHGRFIHLTGFKKTVEDVYGLEADYWLFREEDRIRAVFPSFFHRACVTGRKLISQPFSEYGGVLFATDAGAAERQAILSGLPQVVEKSREKGRLAYLEIRDSRTSPSTKEGCSRRSGCASARSCRSTPRSSSGTGSTTASGRTCAGRARAAWSSAT